MLYTSQDDQVQECIDENWPDIGYDCRYYPLHELQRHSWQNWFCQRTSPGTVYYWAKNSAEKVFHNYVVDDDKLYKMRLNDWVKRANFTNDEHYERRHVDSYNSGRRTPDVLCNIPTLMLQGMRHDSSPGYSRTALNLPIGTSSNSMAYASNCPVSDDPLLSQGWRKQEHSDLKNQPIFTIYRWYDKFIKEGLGILPPE